MRVVQFYPAIDYVEIHADIDYVLTDGNNYFLSALVHKDNVEEYTSTIREVKMTDRIYYIMNSEEEGDDIG